MSWKAVVVEDDEEQLEYLTDFLIGLDFDVTAFDCASGALSYLENGVEQGNVDLFVLDRYLPFEVGGNLGSSFGDRLFDKVIEKFPDSRVFVFSGALDEGRLLALINKQRALVEVGDCRINHVSLYAKDASLEFEKDVAVYVGYLRELSRIELRQEPSRVQADDTWNRILRRVAFEYGASSIEASFLSGGLSGSQVWHCKLYDEQSALATIVVKDGDRQYRGGGLAEILPANLSTSTIRLVAGGMHGSVARVLQFAGDGASSVMEVLGASPERAVSMVEMVARELGKVDTKQSLVTVREIVDTLFNWDEAALLASEFGVSMVDPGMHVTVNRGVRHGDLHLDNILSIGSNPILIDFDDRVIASSSVDAVTMFLCTLCHTSSPLHGESWPSVDDINEFFGSGTFGKGHAWEFWLTSVSALCVKARDDEREFWSVVFAYCIRRLKYPDVRSDLGVLERVIALCKLSSLKLKNS